MIDFKWCSAIVTNIEDPNQKGKVQVRVLPYLKDVKEDLLPWYDPFVGVGSTDEVSFNPPKVGSNVIVLYKDTFQYGFYIGQDYIEGFFDYASIESKLSGVTELSDTTYPNLHFKLTEEGNLYFHNVNTGDEGTLHKSGSYTMFDAQGNIIANAKGNKHKVYNDLYNLKELLDEIQAVVTNIITPNNLVGNNGAPVIYTQVGTDLPTMQLLATKIDGLLLDT